MAATAPMPGLHGREAETSVLSRALDRAAAGRLAVVLAEGEAGIGKTRLLAETLTHARERGMRVAAGRAGELESARPFGVIAEALECARPSVDPRRSAIAALLSTRGGDGSPITVSSDPGLQFRAVDAITDLAEELAVDRPLVIGLDDLQWADQSSLLTLAALGRRLAGLPAALIACFRPSPRDPALQRLL
ncbi:MAG: ATP-binding protein, partial [Streptosporangiaceae bacterium]